MIKTESAPRPVFELRLTPREQLAADLGDSIADKIAQLEPELPMGSLPQRARMIPDDWITSERDRRLISRTFRNLARFSRKQALDWETYKDKPLKPYTYYVPSLQTVEDARGFDFGKHSFVIRGLGPITLQFAIRAFGFTAAAENLDNNS